MQLFWLLTDDSKHCQFNVCFQTIKFMTISRSQIELSNLLETPLKVLAKSVTNIQSLNPQNSTIYYQGEPIIQQVDSPFFF